MAELRLTLPRRSPTFSLYTRNVRKHSEDSYARLDYCRYAPVTSRDDCIAIAYNVKTDLASTHFTVVLLPSIDYDDWDHSNA
jgi:hypothetical protein